MIQKHNTIKLVALCFLSVFLLEISNVKASTPCDQAYSDVIDCHSRYEDTPDAIPTVCDSYQQTLNACFAQNIPNDDSSAAQQTVETTGPMTVEKCIATLGDLPAGKTWTITRDGNCSIVLSDAGGNTSTTSACGWTSADGACYQDRAAYCAAIPVNSDTSSCGSVTGPTLTEALQCSDLYQGYWYNNTCNTDPETKATSGTTTDYGSCIENECSSSGYSDLCVASCQTRWAANDQGGTGLPVDSGSGATDLTGLTDTGVPCVTTQNCIDNKAGGNYGGAYCSDDGTCVLSKDYSERGKDANCQKSGAAYYDPETEKCASKTSECDKAGYQFSTKYNECRGGVGAECEVDDNCGSGYNCVANDSGTLACQLNTWGKVSGGEFGSGSSTTKSNGGSAGGQVVKTNQPMVDSTGKTYPTGTSINTATGVATLPNGTTVQLPKSDLNAVISSVSGGGSMTLCANAVQGQICETSGGSGSPLTIVSGSSGGSGGSGLGNVAGVSGASAPKCGANFSEIGGVCFPTNTGLSSAPISSILGNLFAWLMGLFTTLAVMAFVVSGIQYLTAAGYQDQMEAGKRNATYAIIGIIVGLSGFVIIKAIAAALAGQGYFF